MVVHVVVVVVLVVAAPVVAVVVAVAARGQNLAHPRDNDLDICENLFPSSSVAAEINSDPVWMQCQFILQNSVWRALSKAFLIRRQRLLS